jgi:hypothetical protein
MDKEFVGYTEALALKELGFDEPCFGFFYEDEEFELCPVKNNNLMGYTNAPLYQQAFRWFREKYGYDVSIKKCTPSEYKFEIEQLFVEGNNYYFIDFSFPSHEVAEIECIKKLIEIVKQK